MMHAAPLFAPDPYPVAGGPGAPAGGAGGVFHVHPPAGGSFGPATMEVIAQWAREGRVPREARIVGADGSSMLAGEHPRLMAIVNAPPTVSGQLSRPVVQDEGGVSVIIPYKNGAALAGYYVSIAALIPVLGLVLGPVAIVLGVLGIRARNRNPAVHGLAHAWVAIILGSLVVLGHVVAIVGIAAIR